MPKRRTRVASQVLPASKQPRLATQVLVACLVVGAAAAGGGLLVHLFAPARSQAVQPAPGRTANRARTFMGARGPWGQLEYTRIAISVPADYAAQVKAEPPLWRFPKMERSQVEALLAHVSLSSQQKEKLAQSPWRVDAEGVTIEPPLDLILELSPSTRGKIYDLLSNHIENGEHRYPAIFYPEFLQERIESSGVSQESLKLFHRLLYPRGSWLLFSDRSAALSRIADQEERIRFVQMVYRNVTFLVSVKVDQGSDLEAMHAYWAYPGRPKGLRVLFESLAMVPGGGTIDIAHLLPPFARKWLYTYADLAGDPLAERRDCGWSSMNFFNERADDRFTDAEEIRRTMAAKYQRVQTPKFGDLVLLVEEHRAAEHVAVYIADDLVFTKNGMSVSQPWLLMKLDALKDLYSVVRDPGQELEVAFFRRNDMMSNVAAE
jgi:hypothetical protein